MASPEAWMENKILLSSSGGYDIDSCGTHLGQRISRPAELPEFSWPPESILKENGPIFTSRMPLEMHTVSTEVARDVGAVEQISSQHHISCAASHVRGCPEEANRLGCSCALEQSLLCSNRTGSRNPSYGDTLLGGLASTGQKAGGKSLHDEAQKFINSCDNRVDNLPESRGRSHMEGDMKEDLKAIDKENIKSSSTDDLSSKHHHSPSNCLQHVKSNKLSESSLRLDGKSRLPSYLAAEKLWDGSLQLNASATVSVVAFFKSGEKLLDLKWSEFIEVKGKVRLDAFEKYVGDLRRARTRGLMVVSICFKEGASEKGLKGMKEVARGYLKGERVGLAKLSPGVDIYLCPRSDAIITILSKNKYLNEAPAVEVNSELMIGCVVWRKNATALTSVLEKPEEKSSSLQEQLQKPPSDSSMLQGGGQGSLSVPSIENSNPSAPLSSFSNLEQANVTADKSVGINSSSRTTLTAPGVKLPPFQQKESELSSSHLWGSTGHLSSSEISYAHQSNDEPPNGSMNLPKPVISLLPNASKRKMAFSDDDLPEFDFGTGSGRSSSFHHSDGSILGNRLQLSGSRILDMSKQPTRPVAPSVFMSIPRSVISVSKEMPLIRNVNDHSQFDSSSRKNLFCDDDMPEWLPPPKTLPHESSNSTARTLLPLPTASVFPYPPPMPTQIGPSYLSGFSFSPVRRPQSSSRSAASSVQPSDKRV